MILKVLKIQSCSHSTENTVLVSLTCPHFVMLTDLSLIRTNQAEKQPTPITSQLSGIIYLLCVAYDKQSKSSVSKAQGFKRLTQVSAQSHLDDDRRVLLGGVMHGGFSMSVFDVGAGLTLLQQLLHTCQVSSLTRQVQRCLTWYIPIIDLAEETYLQVLHTKIPH